VRRRRYVFNKGALIREHDPGDGQRSEECIVVPSAMTNAVPVRSGAQRRHDHCVQCSWVDPGTVVRFSNPPPIQAQLGSSFVALVLHRGRTRRKGRDYRKRQTCSQAVQRVDNRTGVHLAALLLRPVHVQQICRADFGQGQGTIRNRPALSSVIIFRQATPVGPELLPESGFRGSGTRRHDADESPV
jgi:hypothetical protein